MDTTRSRLLPLVNTILSSGDRERIERARVDDVGHGFDVLGLSRDWMKVGVALVNPIYEKYFRVTSEGAEFIPASGPTIVAANHSGMLPVDAAMLYLDLLKHAPTDRVPRPIMDSFVPVLPFVSTFFARMGASNGARRNVEWLLSKDELVLIFPEGVPGISKPFSERYRLQDWRVGHAELALRYRAKVVPAAVIGAEEQWIQIGRIKRLHPFGAPHLPIPLTLLPLPVHYHIYYGEPVDLADEFAGEDHSDPMVVAKAARRIKDGVQDLIARGLRERRGIFV